MTESRTKPPPDKGTVPDRVKTTAPAGPPRDPFETSARSTPVSRAGGSGAERRTTVRYPVMITAEVSDTSKSARLGGRVTDLSLGGCYVDTFNPLPVGTDVQIILTHANKNLEAQARVAYGLVGMGMGLSFTSLTPENLEILREWTGELCGEVTPIPENVTASDAAPQSQRDDRRALKHLIQMLFQKGILTQAESEKLLEILSQ